MDRWEELPHDHWQRVEGAVGMVILPRGNASGYSAVASAHGPWGRIETTTSAEDLATAQQWCEEQAQSWRNWLRAAAAKL